MRTLQGEDRVSNGLKGILILLLVVGVGQSFTSVPMLFATPVYFAQFTDTGGLNTGDKVRIAGVDVGRVQTIDIEGDKVTMGFTLGGQQIGTDSRAAIRTDTILGKKNLQIEPRGTKTLSANGMLPVGQTTTPYQIYDAFFDVTEAAQGWDTKTVKTALNTLSDTIDQTAPHLTDALQGLEQFSDVIGKRDEQIEQLLGNANKIAKVLGDRSGQVNALLVNAQQLLAAINERGYAITVLLDNVSSFSAQVQGVIDDNPNLNRVLEQLREVSDILIAKKAELVDGLTNVKSAVVGLGEVVSSGPYFKTLLVNLVPYQILQPFVDAAFKKRGIDPQQFWANAGLPSFRFPDPNGTRQPNGAPPPPPTVLEGTPEFPGPAVVQGSPCSYTPAPGNFPTPGNPLPCAQATVGPFGGPGFPPPNVVSSPADPLGPPPGPGLQSSGLPGQTPPAVPGTQVPLPPAPPNARTEPPGPVSGPFPPPAIAPGPLPPPPAPGPGQQLPPVDTAPLPGNPPFVPPDQVGGR